jgi:hypothetical protein
MAVATFFACEGVLEEREEGIAVATVTVFEVADTSAADSIAVHLAGTIGTSSAYRFDHIDTTRTDSLFAIVVWGRWEELSNRVYPPNPPSFDTTLILQSPRLGLHYIDVYSSGSIRRDSTIVF